MKFIAIIPARFQSTRFPGKPLAILGGKPIIQWVYENAAKSLSEVYVATDDERIYQVVESFGGKAVYTSANHQSGTDRCAEAARKIAETLTFDVVINIQGDEPFVRPEQVDGLKQCFDSPETEIATLVKPIANQEEIFNINRPKVVISKKEQSLEKSKYLIDMLFGKILNKSVVNNFATKDTGFKLNDKCIGCGKCEKVCSVSNIIMADGKPTWNHHCEFCLGCLQSCPAEAINYADKTQKKIRYINPNVSLQ